jgi:hypothetical protein
VALNPGEFAHFTLLHVFDGFEHGRTFGHVPIHPPPVAFGTHNNLSNSDHRARVLAAFERQKKRFGTLPQQRSVSNLSGGDVPPSAELHHVEAPHAAWHGVAYC